MSLNKPVQGVPTQIEYVNPKEYINHKEYKCQDIKDGSKYNLDLYTKEYAENQFLIGKLVKELNKTYPRKIGESIAIYKTRNVKTIQFEEFYIYENKIEVFETKGYIHLKEDDALAQKLINTPIGMKIKVGQDAWVLKEVKYFEQLKPNKMTYSSAVE